MFKLPQDDTRTLLAIHGWSGILLGLLLYAVICTGVAAVFAVEINDWASPLPHARAAVPFAPGLDQTVRRLAAQVDPQFLEEIAVYSTAGGRINARYHRHETDPGGEPSERGVEFDLDPVTWSTLAQREGWDEEIQAQTRSTGVADFLVNLHVRLHIPEPYGLLVTGVLGLAMMIAAVTALLVHRHLLAELFTMRLGRDALLRRRDLHVVAGSWNLPFAFILAFTGSFFSFASTIGLPAMAMVKFGGDQEVLIDTLYGTERPENLAAAPLANIETMLADARQRTHAEPEFVSISHYGRADASVTIYGELPEDTLVYSGDLYDGTNGQHLRTLPPLGTIPSIGASLVGLMYPLHFGNFAGAVSKGVWVLLGLGAAYVSLTGMLLWTRRREDQVAWRRMARLVHFMGYGLPLALACAPYAFFALRTSAVPTETSQGIAFLAVAAIAAIAAFGIKDLDRLRRVLLAATGLSLLGLPVMRMATGGPGWTEAWRIGAGAVPAIDLAMIVFGCVCFWAASRRRAQVASPADAIARAMESEAPTT